MKKYWKVKLLEDLLKIKDDEMGTITMKWVHYLEEKLGLIKQAYKDGWKDAKKEEVEQ